MNRKHIAALVILIVATSTEHANASVTVALNPSASQVDTSSSASVSLGVSATTTQVGGIVLTVGAGYTLTCPQETNPHKNDTAQGFSGTPAGVSRSVTATGTHAILSYSTLPKEQSMTCTVLFMGRAAEGATGTSNTGFDFVFQVEGLVQGHLTGNIDFDMHKPNSGNGGPGCK